MKILEAVFERNDIMDMYVKIEDVKRLIFVE